MKLGLCSSPEDAFLEFVYATEEEGLIQLIIRSKHQSCCCSDCGKASFRPHSHYTRIVQVITAFKMYHLCISFYHLRQRNIPLSAKQFTTSTSCIM